ncbi:MAG TPA: hypothetical protein VJT16_06825 [Streptosporangiaceae bacterium]|nr:hypothetical protein [Streptosporangiaceae bacterium]
MAGPPSPIPLADIAKIGPYFELTSDRTPEGTGWLAARTLIDDEACLSRLIDDVAARLRTRRRWIAASVFYQGWAARLTSIYAASAALCGAVPELSSSIVSFRPRQAGPVALNIEPLRSVSPAAGWRLLREDHLGPLETAVRDQVRIGEYVLRGNLASALAGALTMVSAQCDQPLGSLLRRDWAQPSDLSVSGRWLRTPDGIRYARATCCGFDQLADGSRCGDCSLNWPGGRTSRRGPDP